MSSSFSMLAQTSQIPPAGMAIYSTPGAPLGTGWDSSSNLLMIAVSLAIAALLLWTSWTRIVDTIHVLRRGASARDLFLKMIVKFGPNKSDAYLRYIDRREADIVTTIKPVKGQQISLVMGSLPGFPANDLQVAAQVVKIRSLGGIPEKYLVVSRFSHLPETAESPLLTYIHSLVTPGRVYS